MTRRGRGPKASLVRHLGELAHEKYKKREIAALKKRFPNIVGGVGDKVSDANAYLASGLEAVIIGPERDDGLPGKAIWVKTWAEVEKLLKAPGALEKCNTSAK